MKPAYYNEFDKQTAAWLRELIRQGHIAPGDVDERSIEDVNPDDLRGYTQCHFFAGIGVWSYALRRAGWPDDRPIWTGSCPCQPFSAAGKGAAFDDERHLWPAFHHLIKVGRPATILGEQVASKAVDPWVDLVHADLEALGYAFGSVPFPSAGVGAPHIRDRNYWMADAERARVCGQPGSEHSAQAGAGDRQHLHDSFAGGDVERMADADGRHASTERQQRGGQQRQQSQDGRYVQDGPTGPTNGLWRDADWLGCRDGKWRPVEPGTFPLVAGAAARVVRLRGYGNAINAEQAKIWIETVMECIG